MEGRSALAWPPGDTSWESLHPRPAPRRPHLPAQLFPPLLVPPRVKGRERQQGFPEQREGEASEVVPKTEPVFHPQALSLLHARLRRGRTVPTFASPSDDDDTIPKRDPPRASLSSQFLSGHNDLCRGAMASVERQRIHDRARRVMGEQLMDEGAIPSVEEVKMAPGVQSTEDVYTYKRPGYSNRSDRTNVRPWELAIDTAWGEEMETRRRHAEELETKERQRRKEEAARMMADAWEREAQAVHRRRGAVVIQRAFRRHLARRRNNVPNTALHDQAARTIQRFLRTCVDRRRSFRPPCEGDEKEEPEEQWEGDWEPEDDDNDDTSPRKTPTPCRPPTCEKPKEKEDEHPEKDNVSPTRTFLRRHSQRMQPQRLDWSRVKPQVDSGRGRPLSAISTSRRSPCKERSVDPSRTPPDHAHSCPSLPSTEKATPPPHFSIQEDPKKTPTTGHLHSSTLTKLEDFLSVLSGDSLIHSLFVRDPATTCPHLLPSSRFFAKYQEHLYHDALRALDTPEEPQSTHLSFVWRG